MGAAVHASLRGSGKDDGAAIHYDWSHKYFDNNFKVLKARNPTLQGGVPEFAGMDIISDLRSYDDTNSPLIPP